MLFGSGHVMEMKAVANMWQIHGPFMTDPWPIGSINQNEDSIALDGTEEGARSPCPLPSPIRNRAET